MSTGEKLKLQNSLVEILLELHFDTLTRCYSSILIKTNSNIYWIAMSLNHRHVPLAFKVTFNSTRLILSVRVIHI